MTPAEKKFADLLLLLVVVGVGCAMMGFVFASVFSGVEWAVQRLGIKHHFKPNLRKSDIGWVMGVGFGVMAIGGMAWENIKAGHWRKVFMPAFIWPEAANPAPSGVTRFGRVLHWTFAVFAAASLALGIYFIGSAEQTYSERVVERANWDREHPAPGVPGYVLDKVTREDGTIDYRPEPYPVEYSMLWAGIAGALVLLLVGRGCRYILSNE